MILKRLKKRPNFNQQILNKFKSIQLPLDYKKRKSDFIIINNFTKKSVKRDINIILKKIIYSINAKVLKMIISGFLE